MHDSNTDIPESCLSAALPFLTRFLAESRTFYLALLSPDGTVRFVNPALAECLKVDCAVINDLAKQFQIATDGELQGRFKGTGALSPLSVISG